MSTQTIHKTEGKVKTMPLWNVILLDDDDHSYNYVIELLNTVFGHSIETAYIMASEVDSTGRVIVDTCNRERAELKQEQIHEFGADPLIPNCAGSMTAELEPA